MRRVLSGRGEATYLLFCTLGFVVLRETQGFLPVKPRVFPSGCSARRCTRVIARLGATPSGKHGKGGAAAAEEGSGGAFGADDTTRIRKAPLRITPNFQPHDKRRPKTDVIQDITNGAFLTEQSFDMAAMAWAEFTDWSRRTVNRNIAGAPFEFDIRQWCSSTRKWWSRMIEMDVQAKADFFRLYEQGMQERDAWGNQAGTVDARVEDEWDNIYVECQDCYVGSSDTYAGEGRRGAGKGVTSNGAAPAAYYSSSAGATAQDEETMQAASFAPFLESDFDDVFDDEDQEKEEKEGRGGDDDEEGEGDDGEDEIIDCAIRGKWYFKGSDDQPHFSPQ